MSEIRYFTDGEQATAAVLNRPLEDLEKVGQYMSETQFKKNAETNKTMYTGSGIVNYGKPNWSGQNIEDISISYSATRKNEIYGAYHHNPQIVNVNGKIIYLTGVNSNGNKTNIYKFPEGPTLSSIQNSLKASKDYKKGNFIKFNGPIDITSELTNDNYITSRTEYNHYTEGGNTFSFKTSESQINSYCGFKIPVIPGAKMRATIISSREAAVDVSRIENAEGGSPHFYTSTVTTEEKIIEFTQRDDRTFCDIYLYSDANSNGEITFTFKLEILEALVIINKDINQNDLLGDGTSLVSSYGEITRADYIFLESWHELISEKDFVYPYGNTQYGYDSNIKGLSGIKKGDFNGSDTYSLFGEWQENGDTIGRGYKWSTLTKEQQLIMASDNIHNIYMTKDGPVQFRYRIRIIKMLNNKISNGKTGIGNNYIVPEGLNAIKSRGSQIVNEDTPSPNGQNGYIGWGKSDSWCTKLEWKSIKSTHAVAGHSYHSTSGVLSQSYNGELIVIPFGLVHRNNNGAYDPQFNRYGCMRFSDGKRFYETSDTRNSIEDCFNNTTGGIYGSAEGTGRIDSVYFDQINPNGFEDLRNDCNVITDLNTYVSNKFSELMQGELRGKERINNTEFFEGDLFISGSTSAVPNDFTGYFLYISSGTDDYIFYYYKDGKKINTFGTPQDGEELSIYDGTDVSLFKFFTSNNGFRRLSVERTDGTYGLPWATNTKLENIRIVKGGTWNKSHLVDINRKNQVDIFGSIENLPDYFMNKNFEGTFNTFKNDKGRSMYPTGPTAYVLHPSKKVDSSRYNQYQYVNKIIAYNKTGEIKEIPWSLSYAAIVENGDTVGYYGVTEGNYIYVNPNNDGTRDNGWTIVVYYTAICNSAEDPIVGEILSIGNATVKNYNAEGGYLMSNTLNVPAKGHSNYRMFKPLNTTNIDLRSTTFYVNAEAQGFISHDIFNPPSAESTVKAFPYLMKKYDKLYMNIVYKELKKWLPEVEGEEITEVLASDSVTGYKKGQVLKVAYGDMSIYLQCLIDVTSDAIFSDYQISGNNVVHKSGLVTSFFKEWQGTFWGDNGIFEIENKTTTILDDNGLEVLIGTKSIELNSISDSKYAKYLN